MANMATSWKYHGNMNGTLIGIIIGNPMIYIYIYINMYIYIYIPMIFPWSLWNGQEIILIPTRNTLLMTHPTSCNHGSSVGRWSKSKKNMVISRKYQCVSVGWKNPLNTIVISPFFNPIVNQLSVLFRKIHGPAWLFFNLPIGCFFYLPIGCWMEGTFYWTFTTRVPKNWKPLGDHHHRHKHENVTEAMKNG